MTHTKGPWKIENHTDEVGPYTSGRLEIWSNNRHIGNVNEHVDDFNIDKANARLIAAAPEMLAALDRTLRLLQIIESETGYVTEVTQRDLAKLIAKIDGE
jgi:5-methylcytosine-specific restriction endonuclease McrBC regulatory subunit McrC